MRHIAIIGSGIAGLLTAHGLLKAGYQVSLYSDRTPEDWLHYSRPTGTAGRFHGSLDYDRELGLNFWEREALTIDGVYLVFCLQGNTPFITLSGNFARPAVAIDVRLQSYCWMQEFVRRGGMLCIEKVDIPRLDEIASQHDLTLVASGRGSLTELFPRDEKRSVYSTPQRNLMMLVVKNAAADIKGMPFRPVKFNFLSTEGEAFWVPYHHKTEGATWNLVFEARPGRKLDRFMDAKTGEEALAAGKGIIKDLFPWDWAWAKDMQLADDQGWLVGRFAPSVREPVGKLPSGRVVMPVGDTAMTFDPIAGQGANNGTRMARHLVRSIIAHGDRPFGADWMRTTFDQFYHELGEPAYRFNNIFFEEITPAGKALLIAQYGSDGKRQDARQSIANAFCENFNNPHLITDLFHDLPKARAFIERTTGRSWRLADLRGRAGIIRDQVRQKLGMQPLAGYWQ
jgi:hypothetical protein